MDVTQRLTARDAYGNAYFPRCFEEPCNGKGCEDDACAFITEVCDRLAKYEERKVRKVIVKSARVKAVPVNVRIWESLDPLDPLDRGKLYKTGDCPNCGQSHSEKIDLFCNRCGAELDWERAKEEDKHGRV